jgi:hypothetical protein
MIPFLLFPFPQTYLIGQAMYIAGPDIMDPTTKFHDPLFYYKA